MEEQRRMQNAVNDILNDIDRKCLRTLQIQMHECAINCCKDPSNDVESLQACNENCSKQITAAQHHIQNQFNNWQSKIYRCVQDCNDDVADKISNPRDPNELEMIKYRKESEACASSCVSKHIKLLPQLANKIVNTLNNK